jgi:hypothetical protein
VLAKSVADEVDLLAPPHSSPKRGPGTAFLPSAHLISPTPATAGPPWPNSARLAWITRLWRVSISAAWARVVRSPFPTESRAPTVGTVPQNSPARLWRVLNHPRRPRWGDKNPGSRMSHSLPPALLNSEQPSFREPPHRPTVTDAR